MRKCKLRKKTLRAISNMQRKRAAKARKLAKKLEKSCSTNSRVRRVNNLLSEIGG